MPQLIADRPVLHATSDLARVMAAAKAREKAGERILHLERGEPDFDTPRTSSKRSRRRPAMARRTTRTSAAMSACARRWSRSSNARTA